jgi:hypothetical protein
MPRQRIERLSDARAGRDRQDRGKETERVCSAINAPEQVFTVAVAQIPQVTFRRVRNELAGNNPTGNDIARPPRRRIVRKPL